MNTEWITALGNSRGDTGRSRGYFAERTNISTYVTKMGLRSLVSCLDGWNTTTRRDKFPMFSLVVR